MESHVVFTKFLFIILIFLFVGCDDMSVSTGDGSNKVKGNGKVTTEVREIGSFDEIILEGVFNVYLLQKEKESVRVETDENLLPFIVTEVENNVLTIKMKDNSEIEKMKKINIYITLVDINNLETKGVGLINCMGQLKLKNIDLSLNGVGATHLNLICDTLNVSKEKVLDSIGSDSRIGNKYFRPGYSFGGPCFPRDTKALKQLMDQNNVNSNILSATTNYNEEHIIFQAKQLHEKKLDKYIIENICYKENSKIPIIEESAKLKIAKKLKEWNNKVIIQDSEELILEVKKEYGNLFEYNII